MGEFITIKKGPVFETVVAKDMLINIQSSAEGIIFNFKNGIQMMCNDDKMPIHTKSIIENSTINIFKSKADIVYDLHNYDKPVNMIMLTK